MSGGRDGSAAVQKMEDLDIGGLVVKGVTNVVKQRPVSVSLWAVGLLLAYFATGFSVDEATQESYSITMSHAAEVDRKELNKAYRNYQEADQKYYNAKGWFWSCDDRCQKAKDNMEMAKANVDRIQAKKDKIVKEGRKEVGIWSVYGVKDVRDSFWVAWKSGKDFAARYTMMDAMFMMIGGKEETLVHLIIKIVFQYIVNLTMGLVMSFFFFIYNVYCLIVAYGEPALSGLAFFLLVLVAGVATVGSYLFAIYGTVAGGGIYLMKQAAKQAKLEGERGGRRRQINHGQYGGGRVGGRSHFD